MLKNGLVKFSFINFIYKLKKVNKAQNAENWACQIFFYRL